ncbi:MAG: DUF3667 domain-containing protein, partial [Bacteroidales bacterium]|nr:DUF3667 domain-containing protein [Bacteroidales bacterium]
MKNKINQILQSKRDKKKLEQVIPEEVICKNCQNEFKGKFCPECGQSVKEWNRPFSILIYDFFGTVLSFDTRFFTTLGSVIFKPGKFSSDFLAGKRNIYMPPFQFYVFVSFVFFLLLNVQTTKLINQNMESEAVAVVDSLS